MEDRQAIRATLIQLVENETDTELPDMEDSMSLRDGLGLDSVDLVGVIMRIEQQYHIRLSQSELEQTTTVGQLIDLIANKGQADQQAA